MTASSARPLVVGLDHSARNEVAVRWAGDEAARGGLPLLVLCGYPAASSVASHPVPAASAYVADDEAHDEAQQALDLAMTTVNACYPSVHACGRIVRESTYDAILSVAKHADTVIVGARGSRHHISGVGVLRQPLTSRSPVPIVVMPPESAATPDGEVLVGITLGRDTHTVLAYAFEHARRHEAPIRILCCAPPRHAALNDEATWTLRETEEHLFDTLTVWQNIYPDVQVSSAVLAAHSTAELILDADHSRLLVISGPRRRGTDWVTRHRVNRLLRWTRRPVAVVPASTATQR